MDPKLIEAINSIPAPAKDSKNGHFKNQYASLDSVTTTIKRVLAEAGYAITQTFDGDALITQVVGKEGVAIESSITLPFDKASGPNYWQVMGQGITYLRRYALCAMFCLVAGDVDDDAELATWYAGEQKADVPVERYESKGKPNAPKASPGVI